MNSTGAWRTWKQQDRRSSCMADTHCDSEFIYRPPPQAHLPVVDMLPFMSFDVNQQSLPTPFYSALSVYFCLCDPYSCASSHGLSWQLSTFSLSSSGLISASLVLSTIYLFMKVSLIPDITLCGWLGLKHQFTNKCSLPASSFHANSRFQLLFSSPKKFSSDIDSLMWCVVWKLPPNIACNVINCVVPVKNQ